MKQTMGAEHTRGFTLVEVLVALAVVVTAFLAMYGSAQQIVSATILQQDKTFATWVAQNQLAELRLAAQLPQGSRISDSTELAGREWRYVIEFQELDSTFFKQAVVRVSPAEEPDLILAQALAVLRLQPVAATAGGSGAQLGTSAVPPGGSSQADTDGDGILDGQDPDIDGDGIPNAEDPDTPGFGLPDDQVIDDATGREF